MTKTSTAVDTARLQLGDIENALLDELSAGRIDRRVFLRHASRLGIGLPLLSALTAAEGLGLGSRRALAAGAAGGVVRAGVAMPHGAIDPVMVNDSGSYQMIFQVAEFLCVTEPDLTLRPVLAENWSHDRNGTIARRAIPDC